LIKDGKIVVGGNTAEWIEMMSNSSNYLSSMILLSIKTTIFADGIRHKFIVVILNTA